MNNLLYPFQAKPNETAPAALHSISGLASSAAGNSISQHNANATVQSPFHSISGLASAAAGTSHLPHKAYETAPSPFHSISGLVSAAAGTSLTQHNANETSPSPFHATGGLASAAAGTSRLQQKTYETAPSPFHSISGLVSAAAGSSHLQQNTYETGPPPFHSIGGLVSAAAVTSLSNHKVDGTATSDNGDANNEAAAQRSVPALSSSHSLWNDLCVGKFTEKLMSVLGREETAHALSWLPDGKSFRIVDQASLVADVLPQFFKESKYGSFNRKLRRWGFKRKADRKFTCFYHELFVRDKPHMCKFMRSSYTIDKGMKKQGVNQTTESDLKFPPRPSQVSSKAPIPPSIVVSSSTSAVPVALPQNDIHVASGNLIASQQQQLLGLNMVCKQRSNFGQLQQFQTGLLTNQQLYEAIVNEKSRHVGIEGTALPGPLLQEGQSIMQQGIQQNLQQQQQQHQALQLQELQRSLLATQQLFHEMNDQAKMQDQLLQGLLTSDGAGSAE